MRFGYARPQYSKCGWPYFYQKHKMAANKTKRTFRRYNNKTQTKY